MLELIIKVRQVHSEITESPLPRYLTWIGITQAVWKSIKHVLETTTIPRKEAPQLAK